MRGVISAIVPDGTYGQVAATDGQRYSYWTSEVRNGQVRVGQMVEFQMWEGQPIDIFVVNNPPPPNAAPPQRTAAPQQRAAAGAPAGNAAAARGYAARATGIGAAMAGAGAIPSSNNYWVNLFTTTEGRISRKEFWLYGVLPLIGASIVLRIFVYIALFIMPVTLILFADLAIFLILLWPQFCISSKRFHDVGYPGWYNLIWIGPLFLAQLLSSLDLFLYNFAYLLGVVSLTLSGIGALVALAALIFVYIRVGQEGPNQYGPDPLMNA
jgi:uncharacterized membrane protein YhaH (DUF805 family)